ncbi:sel1 repeat family protein, partial [Francisella tularensis subsp. holarctica]|nr:sel1 repeat family protein [Francisella tularensis subsp. holarctica]
NGLKKAQRNRAKIKLSKQELELATKEQQSLINSWQQNAVTSK